jgi:hypothetical protein
MKKIIFYCNLAVMLSLLVACGQRESGAPPKSEGATTTPTATVPAPPQPAGPALTEFKCELSARGMPKQLQVNSDKTIIEVSVTNKSSAKWFAFLAGRSIINSVRIGYQWWREKKMVVEGGRAELPSDLGPNQTASVQLEVLPPKTPGTYTLRIEPVQEAVAWFGDAGGCKVEATVKVAR